MIYIIHRVNKISELKEINKDYGVEVDVRINNNTLYLNHEPSGKGDNFEKYLDSFNHKFLIANIKDSGIENLVINLLKNRNINFFLLDVEYPFIFQSIEKGFREIAIRLSIFEPYENLLSVKDYFDWIWIDSYKSNPLVNVDLNFLRQKKISLVCPSRWQQKNEIMLYKEFSKINNICFHSVMTSLECIKYWDE